MKGERKIPTRMLTPKLNQLELTFLMISVFRIVLRPSVNYCLLRLAREPRA